MSALSIQVPFPVFQDRDGQPLDNGYVWIGTANLNPQTNPVATFYDAALTIPAAQPLRTLNGYISRAGTPAQVYVDGVNFSILVQDSKGSMVYNFPDGTGISPDACGVTYDPPFTGGVPYPVCEKLAQYVSIKDFGAVGDNVADDTLAIQAAYDSISTTGGTIWWPEGTYKTSASIVVYSNTTTNFSSGAAIDPVALANFQIINFPTYTFGYALFINKNFTTSTFDVNITYINVRMIPSRKDFTWSQGLSWNGHGIDSRNVQNLKILNSYGENLADFCGVLHCNEVLVQGNWCIGMSNSSYDFWEGCSRVRLINNVAKTANNSTNWNAVDTQVLGSFNANNFLCEGNHFEGGPGAAIFVSPLNATSTCTNVKIVNNTIDQLNITTPDNPNGINIQATSNCIVSNNTLRRIGAGFSPIIVTADGFGVLSNNASICDNVIEDSALVNSSYIAAFGTKHYISGNQDVNSSSTSAAYIQVDSPTTIIMPQQFTGTVANEIINATNLNVPTTPAFEFRTITSQDQWFVRQGIRTDDGFKHSTAYALTATGIDQGTALPLTAEFNFVSTTPAGTGVKLPLGNAKNIGMEVMVFNNGGANLVIYPAAGNTIGGGNQTIATSTKMKFVCITADFWIISGT